MTTMPKPRCYMEKAGLSSDDSDDFHGGIDGDLQTLLTLALFRSKALREHLHSIGAGY